MKLEPCCAHCTNCGHAYCRDENPSPREDRLCGECSALAEGLAGWGGLA